MLPRRLFLQSPANPDLLYIIFFCHTQLTVTLLLCLIFGSKVRNIILHAFNRAVVIPSGPTLAILSLLVGRLNIFTQTQTAFRRISSVEVEVIIELSIGCS